MANRPGVMFYFSLRPCLKRLNLEEKGRLLEAILDYAECGTIPEVDGMIGIAWDFVQPLIDQDASSYAEKCNKNRYATYVRESKKINQVPLPFDDWKTSHVISHDENTSQPVSSDIEWYPITITDSIPITNSITKESKADKPPARSHFVPPSVDEVREYCQSQGYTVDPTRFVNYYQSNGWKVGKNTMKDWKAAVRSWNSRNSNGAQDNRKTIEQMNHLPGIVNV